MAETNSPSGDNRTLTPELLRTFALSIVQRLRDAGFVALLAGGCVRDMLLGVTPHDYDVATDATPAQVQKLFRRALPVGAQFGVIEILGHVPGMHVQVATFRSDGQYSDGRHPDSVRFGTPEEDAQRRDFTINGLFLDPVLDQVFDFVGGQADLQQKVVRAIGHPHARIEEDKLRMLRGIRFVSRLGFTFDSVTEAAISELHRDINQVSAERITDELKKMLKPASRGKALQLLDRTGLLRVLLPTWSWSSTRSLTFPACSHVPGTDSFPLVWSALLLDLQKQLRADQPIEKQEIQEAFGNRFRLSHAEIAQVQYLLSSLEQVRQAHRMQWAQLKPLLAHPNRSDLFLLFRACLTAWQYEDTGLLYCQERLAVWSDQDLQPPPLITGEDIAQRGIPPGPRYKQLLESVRTEQLNETIQTRQDALELLQKLLGQP